MNVDYIEQFLRAIAAGSQTALLAAIGFLILIVYVALMLTRK